MKKRYVIYLIGWPGVGKLTIAKEIQKHDDSFVIMHNHLTHDCISPFVESGKVFTDESMGAISEIKNIILNFIINHGRKDQSIIFTNVLINNYGDSEDKSFERIKKFAHDIDAVFIPIRLICETDEIKKRMISKERRKFNKTMKPEVIDDFISKNYTVLTIDHKNELTLDITNLQPNESAQEIFKHCDMIK